MTYGTPGVLGTPQFFVPTPSGYTATGDATAAGTVATIGSQQVTPSVDTPIGLDVVGYPLILPTWVTNWAQIQIRPHWTHQAMYPEFAGAPCDLLVGFWNDGPGFVPAGSVSSLEWADPDGSHVGIDIATIDDRFLRPASGTIGPDPWINLLAQPGTSRFGGGDSFTFDSTILGLDVIWPPQPTLPFVPQLRLWPRHDKRLYPPTRSRGARPLGYL